MSPVLFGPLQVREDHLQFAAAHLIFRLQAVLHPLGG